MNLCQSPHLPDDDARREINAEVIVKVVVLIVVAVIIFVLCDDLPVEELCCYSLAVGDRGTKYLSPAPFSRIVAEIGGREPPFPPENIFSGFFLCLLS